MSAPDDGVKVYVDDELVTAASPSVSDSLSGEGVKRRLAQTERAIKHLNFIYGATGEIVNKNINQAEEERMQRRQAH